jgi:hypothetical protein
VLASRDWGYRPRFVFFLSLDANSSSSIRSVGMCGEIIHASETRPLLLRPLESQFKEI